MAAASLKQIDRETREIVSPTSAAVMAAASLNPAARFASRPRDVSTSAAIAAAASLKHRNRPRHLRRDRQHTSAAVMAAASLEPGAALGMDWPPSPRLPRL